MMSTTTDRATEARARWRAGETVTVIGSRFGVSEQTVGRMIRGLGVYADVPNAVTPDEIRRRRRRARSKPERRTA